jgi:hypothetical protein
MMIGHTRKVASSQLLNGLNALVGRLQKSYKVHDYRHQQHSEYAFELIDHGSKGHMTGQGSRINQGDRILLRQDGQTVSYQVQAVEYYAAPSDLWTALLVNVG